MDAPEYDPGDSLGAVYCNSDCQKGDWPNHKAQCRALKHRKKLLRTASTLKAALLTYREVNYDIDLTKIELKDGILYLYQNQRPMTAPAKRGPFPLNLTTNIEHKEAALATNQCTTAMALLSGLTRKLLEGLMGPSETEGPLGLTFSTLGAPWTIEVLDLHIGKPKTPTKLFPGPDSSNAPHTVLKLSSKPSNNETWILDTAGCQYGFREVLVPYKKYLMERSCRISNGTAPYDATETKDLDYFATLPFMNQTKTQREDMKQERKARLHFACFVKEQASKDIVDGSTAMFSDNLDIFIYELKLHLLNLGK